MKLLILIMVVLIASCTNEPRPIVIAEPDETDNVSEYVKYIHEQQLFVHGYMQGVLSRRTDGIIDAYETEMNGKEAYKKYLLTIKSAK